MTLTQALDETLTPLVTLETMTDDDFDAFCDRLPPRVLLMARGGLVSWQDVINTYYYSI